MFKGNSKDTRTTSLNVTVCWVELSACYNLIAKKYWYKKDVFYLVQRI